MDQATSRSLIRQAIDPGIRFFDTVKACSNSLSEEFADRGLEGFGRHEAYTLCPTASPTPWSASPSTGASRRYAPVAQHAG